MTKQNLVILNGKLAARIAAKKVAIKELEVEKLQAQRAQLEKVLNATGVEIAKKQAILNALK